MTAATASSKKIVPLTEIGKRLDNERAAGRSIVLCHGAFDLLHVGHVRHLTAAKTFGDVLVVTITADEFIKKGPDRPVFSSHLRAEMLAALGLVDYVAVVEAASAEPAIEAVRPDSYVKGGEYQNEKDDISGKIIAEREMVEEHGGRLVFTHEMTFSSSNLLNRYFGAINTEARDFLSNLNRDDFKIEFKQLVEKVSNLRVLVVGESIVDHYVYVDAMGKAAKENIIATRKREEEFFAGGALAAANHIASMCKSVELITMVGDPESGENFESLITESAHDGVDVQFVRRDAGPTVRKTRFVEPTYVRKLFEVYDMDDVPLPDEVEQRIADQIRSRLPDIDLVIVCDFGHGMMQPSLIEMIQEEAPILALNAQSNAGNIGFNLITKYQRADFACIDLLEARLAARDKHGPPSGLAPKIRAELSGCSKLIVTAGRNGCYLSADDFAEAMHVPVFGDGVVDTVGAGDAFFVVSATFAAAGASPIMTAFIGNLAGALKVKIVGHRRSITALELQQYFATLLK